MRKNLLWTLALGALGLLVNSLALPVFGEMVFRAGSVAALMVAIALGPAWGTLAAAITGLSALAGGDPLLLVVTCFEAATVGWLVRHRLDPLSADLLFWLLFGAPGIAIYGLFVLGQDPASVWVRVAHQPINGVLCAVLAEILLQLWSRRLPGPWQPGVDQRRPLRRQLVHWIALATMLPILLVGLRLGREGSEIRLDEWQRSLLRSSLVVAQRLDDHLLGHRLAVQAVARFVEGESWSSDEAILRQLDAVRTTYPDISTMIAIDGAGEVRVGSPRVGPSGGSWWSPWVGDREYFERPMATGDPFISDVFLGRGYGSGPIIAVSAPVLGQDGQPIGVVEASIAVEIFRDLGRHLGLVGSELLVVDRLDRVLFSTDVERYPLLADLSDSALRMALDRGLRDRFGYARRPSIGRPAGGSQAEETTVQPPHEPMLAARSDVGLVGWQVVCQVPERRLSAAATVDYLTSAFGLLGAIFLAALVASGVAALVTRPLEGLVTVVRRLDADQLPSRLPTIGTTAPREVAELVDGFGAMAVRLEHSYGRLRQTLDERQALNWELEQVLTDLDGRVRDRTAELAEARRRAEQLQEQYRELIDGLEAIVWEFDLERARFTFVSQRVREILGHAPEEWYRDARMWRGIVPAANRRRLLRTLFEAIRRGDNHQMEAEILTRRGDQRWLRNVMRVSKDDDGRPRTLRGVMVDVTAVHRAQEDQLRRRKLESVGTLAGGIAHDFNNLLTAILGNLSLAELGLEDGDRPEEILGHLGEMEKAAEKARVLSQKLLTFARGGLPIRRSVDPASLLREWVSAVPADGIEIELHVAPRLWPVEADGAQLGQVFRELLHNAVQAMPEGGRVEVRAQNAEIRELSSGAYAASGTVGGGASGGFPAVGSGAAEAGAAEPGSVGPGPGPGRWVSVRVRDFGAGIAEEQLGKVFDPYYSTKEKGRGFGLATAYSIVENHGGHIEIASRVGHGTAVTFWIPASEEAPAPSIREPSPRSVQPGRILVMDDEESVRVVAGMMLRHLGWRVELTADGQAAIAAYSRALREGEPFDLVLTDLTVPGGMGGAEAIRRLLEIDPEVRAVVCSGYSNDPVMARYREHGFVGVMAKPFDLAGLRRLLAEVAGQPASSPAAATSTGATSTGTTSTGTSPAARRPARAPGTDA